MDNTLFDTEQLSKNAGEQAIEEMIKEGLQCTKEQGINSIKAIITKKDKFERIVKFFGPDKQEIIDIGKKKYYRDAEFVSLTPFQGVLETLTKLKNSNYRLFLLSQGERSQQERKIKALNIENYFEKSAQSKTYFRVFTEVKNNKVTCGAMMLQIMGENTEDQRHTLTPEELEDNWHRLKLILNTIQPEEIVPGRYLPDSILMRLFAEDIVRVFDISPLTFAAPNTKERMEKALKSIGINNCKELLNEGPIVMTCEFSGKEETFTEKDIIALFADD